MILHCYIFEACNLDGEMFGKELLKSIVRRDYSKNSHALLDKIMPEHARFTYGVDREDDLTFGIVKIV
jgi:serine phosphatase RsbU (regulator of sigma subunit)